MKSSKIKQDTSKDVQNMNPKNTRIVLTSHQSDDILLSVKKLKYYGHNVSLTSTNKFWKNYNVKLTNKEMNSIKANIFDKGKLKPTLIITDNENLNTELTKIKKICTVNNFNTAISNLKQDYYKPLRRVQSESNLATVNVDYSQYPRDVIKVTDFIKDLPRFCIFFTAFGFYQDRYNFSLILKVFQTFLEKQEKIFGNCVMLAIGGNFTNQKHSEENFYKDFYYIVKKTPVKDNVIILKNISNEQKKALLRLSYAFLYFNSSDAPDCDVKLALSVGTPIIGINHGFLKQIFKHDPQIGYLLSPNASEIVSSMYALTSPVNFETASKHSRSYYLKHYTHFIRELKEIQIEERKEKSASKSKEKLAN